MFVDYYTENVLGQKVEKPEDRSAIIAEKRSRAREHVLALMKSHEAEAAKEAQLNAVSITKIKRLVLNDDNSTGACIEFGAICTYSDGTV